MKPIDGEGRGIGILSLAGKRHCLVDIFLAHAYLAERKGRIDGLRESQ
jgi:hypothetical protein